MEDHEADYEVDCHEPGDEEPLAEKMPSEKDSEPEDEDEEEEEEDSEPTVHIQGVCHPDPKYCVRQENAKRGNWWLNGHGTLAMLGAVFVATALQVFPECLYRYGLVFLIVYAALVLIAGFPLMYLEMSLGQFSSSGVLTCWPLPIFKGFGFGMLWQHIPMAIVYNTIGAWSLYYLYGTIVSSANQTPLPWASRDTFLSLAPECNDTRNWWNEKLDSNLVMVDSCKSDIADGGICWTETERDGVIERLPVSTYDLDEAIENLLNGTVYDTPVDMSSFLHLKELTDVYYNCHVMGQTHNSTSISFICGSSVCYLISWALITLTAILGPKSIGPVVNLTVPLALVLMIVLGVKVFDMDGNLDYMINIWTTIDVKEFGNLDVWLSACKMLVFTLFTCSGIHLTFASYNRFHNNYVRDASLVCVFNVMVNALGAIVVIGFAKPYATEKSLPMESVLGENIFQLMPKLFNFTSTPNLYNGLFFAMLFLMIFHPLVGFLEMTVTAVVDQLPKTVRRFRFLFTIGFGIVFFLAGLPLCTSDASGWLNLVDNYWYIYQNYALVILVLFCYIVYGISKYFWYRHDVAAMALWDCCCFPSIIIWMCVTGIGLVLTFLLMAGMLVHNLLEHFRVLQKVGYKETIPAEKPLSDWMTPEFVICVKFSFLIIIGFTMIIHTIVTLIRKKKGAGVLFTKAWKPALAHHESIVLHYRAANQYSTQNYGTLSSENTMIDPENVPLKEAMTPPSEKAPLADDLEDLTLKDQVTPTSEFAAEAV